MSTIGQLKIPKEKRVERSKKANLAKRNAWKLKFEDNLNSKKFDELTNKEKREKIIREQNFKCAECGIDQTWNGKPIKFDLDHVSGCRKDNSRDNLRFLCPNCHSQTPTYKTSNYNRVKRSDIEIIEALKNNVSGYKALISLEMNPHGRNYIRVRNIIKKYNLHLSYTV